MAERTAKAKKKRVTSERRSSKRLREARLRGRAASKSYLALVREFPLRPIRNNDDLAEASAVLDVLLAQEADLDSAERDYFESLTHEIERYEAEHVAMPAVSGAQMLRHLIEARDAKLSEVATGTGIAVSTLSDILNPRSPRKRKLTLNHIRALAAYFAVEPSVFLPD